MKQEVAKEGVFFYEYSIHMVRGWDISPSRWLDKLAVDRVTKRVLGNGQHAHAIPELDERIKGARTGGHGQKALYSPMASSPIPALILHCVFSVGLILALTSMKDPMDAYSTILGMCTHNNPQSTIEAVLTLLQGFTHMSLIFRYLSS